MNKTDYNQVYSAIYDGIPPYVIDNSETSARWAGVDTSFGWGIAVNYPGIEDECLKLACANSYYNRGDNNFLPFDTHYSDGLDFEGKTVGIVGNMNGIVKRYSDICRGIYVFDLEDENCLPQEKENELLPQCDIAVITGSTIQNGTLAHVLSLCENAYTILTGPSVPQCEALLDFGIDMIAGMCVTDVNMMFDFIKSGEKGSPYAFGIPFRIKRR